MTVQPDPSHSSPTPPETTSTLGSGGSRYGFLRVIVRATAVLLLALAAAIAVGFVWYAVDFWVKSSSLNDGAVITGSIVVFIGGPLCLVLALLLAFTARAFWRDSPEFAYWLAAAVFLLVSLIAAITPTWTDGGLFAKIVALAISIPALAGSVAGILFARLTARSR